MGWLEDLQKWDDDAGKALGLDGFDPAGDIWNVFTGAKDRKAAKDAQEAQMRAIAEAQALQREMWQQQRADQQPWLDAGRTTLADLLRQIQGGSFDNKTDPTSIASDPGFQFRMAEGQKALERSAAARGGLNSGGTLKALARYSQGLASDEYASAWNRNEAGNTNRYNRLASLAGVGQASAQNLASHGGQYANNMGHLYGARGSAESAGIIGQQNATSAAYGRTVGTLYGLANGGMNIPQQNGLRAPAMPYGWDMYGGG